MQRLQLLPQPHSSTQLHCKSSRSSHCSCLVWRQAEAQAPCSLLMRSRLQPISHLHCNSSQSYDRSCLMRSRSRAHALCSLQMTVQLRSMQLLQTSLPASVKQASFNHRAAVSVWSAGRLRLTSSSSLVGTCVPAHAVLSCSCTAASLAPCAGLALPLALQWT